MNYEKGDLVLVTNDSATRTCVILTSEYSVSPFEGSEFYYTYCLETGLYGLTYGGEIISLVSKDFSTDFDLDTDMFDMDYTFYDYLFEDFSFYPSFFPSGSLDPD